MVSEVDEREVALLWEELQKFMDKQRSRRRTREGLAALARTLQADLTRYDRPADVPHASALEMLMRAVLADISGDHPDFVIEKLMSGFKQLMGDYKPKSYFEVNELPLR